MYNLKNILKFKEKCFSSILTFFDGVRILGQGLPIQSLYVLLVPAWVLSGYSGFLSLSKNIKQGVGLIDYTKFPLIVNVSVGGLSLYVSPAMNW